MGVVYGPYSIILFATQTHTHFQSGLTALRMAWSEGDHQDVCDILLRYTQHIGSKVISPEQEVSEAKQEEEVKTELAEVGLEDNWR